MREKELAELLEKGEALDKIIEFVFEDEKEFCTKLLKNSTEEELACFLDEFPEYQKFFEK